MSVADFTLTFLSGSTDHAPPHLHRESVVSEYILLKLHLAINPLLPVNPHNQIYTDITRYNQIQLYHQDSPTVLGYMKIEL